MSDACAMFELSSGGCADVFNDFLDLRRRLAVGDELVDVFHLIVGCCALCHFSVLSCWFVVRGSRNSLIN